MPTEQTGAAPLAEDYRTRLRTLVDLVGLARALNVAALPSRGAVERALAGLPLRKGTVALIEQGLDAYESKGAT